MPTLSDESRDYPRSSAAHTSVSLFMAVLLVQYFSCFFDWVFNLTVKISLASFCLYFVICKMLNVRVDN